MVAPKELERLLPSRQSPGPRRQRRLVQVSVRVPVELRDSVHAAASALGINITELVEAALRAEVARVADPAAQFAGLVAANVRERLGAALADGSWDEAVASYTAADTDLA